MNGCAPDLALMKGLQASRKCAIWSAWKYGIPVKVSVESGEHVWWKGSHKAAAGPVRSQVLTEVNGQLTPGYSEDHQV